MTNNQIAEMKQQRAEIAAKIKELNGLAEKEGRSFTFAEEERSEGWEREFRRLESQITRSELELAREAEAARNGNGGNSSARFELTSQAVNGPVQFAEDIIPSNRSFFDYMQSRGMIKRQECEGVTLGALMRAMVTGPRTREERAALAEGADSTGGFSVPDIILSQWVDRLRAQTVCIRAGAVTVPLTTDKTTIVRTLTDPVAAWRAEAGAIALSEPTFEGIVFTARSLDVIVRASREVIEDSVNISSALEKSITGAMAVEVDRVCLVGSGTAPEPRGISNTTNVGSVAGGGALASYDKILDAVYEILVDNGPMPTAIVMPPRTAIGLAKLKEGVASSINPVQIPPLVQRMTQYVTTGLPVNEAPGTASRIILGEFSQLYIGMRTSLTIEVLRELYAANYQFGFLAHLRMDVGVAHPESFAQVTGVLP